jgi:hypothetical protein
VVFSGLSSTNKTDHKDVTEILLKVALNTINPNPTKSKTFSHAEGEVPVHLSLKFVHATENPSYILKGIPLKLITIHVHVMIWRITDRFKILIKPFLKELFPFFSSKYVDRDIHLYMSTFPSKTLFP